MKTRDALIKLFTDNGVSRSDAEGFADSIIAEKADSGEITKLDSAGVRAAFDAVLGKLSESMDANEKLTKSNDKMSGQLANLGAAAKQKKEEDADKSDSNFAALLEIVKAGAAKTDADMTPEQKADASKLGSLLTKLAKEKEVSTEELGKAAGITAGTVNQIMNGEIAIPPESRLRGFAKALGVPLSRLMAATPKKDSDMTLADRLAWTKDRTILEGLAKGQKLDAADVAKLDSAALRKAIVVKAQGDDARADASDDYYLALTDQMSKAGNRQDAAPYASTFGTKPIPAPKSGEDRADGDEPKSIRDDGYSGTLNSAFQDAKPNA